jgi:hypothetical protein
MLKSKTSLLGVNNVIEWELPCFIASHVIYMEN